MPSKRTTKRSRRGRHEGSVFQRADGRWVGSLSLGTRADGRRDRIVVYGETKTEAETELARKKAEAGNGTLTRPDKTTVGQYLDRWLEDVVRPSRAPNTYRSYEMTLRLHIKPQVGAVKLTALTAAQIRGLYAGMQKAGASPRVRQLAHAVLRRALAVAMRDGTLARNVCDAVERPRVARAEMKTLTPQQTRTFLSAAREHRLSALFVVAVATGMRQGELFGLAWDNVDFEASALTVQRVLEEIDGRLRLKEPKSEKSRRRIDLPAFAVDALKEHRKRMLAEGHLAGPVFCDTHGGFLRKSNVHRKVFKPLLAKAELPDVRFHDLRHGHATILLMTGENPKVVQERLGHSQIGVTMDTYSHVLPSVHKKAADKLDRIFRQAAGG